MGTRVVKSGRRPSAVITVFLKSKNNSIVPKIMIHPETDRHDSARFPSHRTLPGDYEEKYSNNHTRKGRGTVSLIKEPYNHRNNNDIN